MFKTASILIVGALCLTLFLPSIWVSADLINPEFNSKHCKPGEKEIIATYSSKEAFGPKTSDETQKYKNNSNYYELTSEGHSFGGKVKYCQTASDSGVVLIGAGVATTAIVAILGLVWLRRRGAR